MLLDNKIFALKHHLYLERYVNDGSPSGFSDKMTSSEPTRSKSLNNSFHLIGLSFNNRVHIQDYGEKTAFADSWQMLAHPDMVYEPENNSLFADCTKFDLNAVLVEPTSSIRTVKIKEKDKDGWFIKLHYDGLIGRIDRKLGRNQAISAVEVSKIIETAIDDGKLPQKFFVQREPFARVVDLYDNNGHPYEYGVVLREPFAYPSNDRIKFLIPAFSLFSKDPQNTNHKSILAQLIDKQTKNVEDFLFEDLIAPVFENYFELLLNCGLQLECHAQNTLFAIDENFKVLGMVAKDMESIDKDISLMADLKINQNIETLNYKCLRRSDYNYQIMHSFMFDFKLGEYLISPIIDDVIKNFPVFNASSFIEKIKRFNHTFIAKLPKDFFSAYNEWYSDKKEIRDRAQKKEYVINKNPKFR
jgi:hypothetical protein